MKLIKGLSVLLLIISIGCDQGEKMSVSTDQPRNITESEFVETNTGLKYSDIKVGSGETAKSGDLVSVHYTGWLTDGKRFDSSVLRQKPFSFPIGQGRVIAGWEEGVAGMQIGGIRQLVIPPDLGYGEAGAGGVIPPGATLVFEVELLEISD
jgi:FKBP-type peptidyl-prolyl cis-trans isomerase